MWEAGYSPGKADKGCCRYDPSLLPFVPARQQAIAAASDHTAASILLFFGLLLRRVATRHRADTARGRHCLHLPSAGDLKGSAGNGGGRGDPLPFCSLSLLPVPHRATRLGEPPALRLRAEASSALAWSSQRSCQRPCSATILNKEVF